MASAQPNTPAISYSYDGDGRRVMENVGGAITTYVYDAQGQLAAEYGAPTDSGTSYLTADHLGSTRLVTDATGAVKKCYDYFPFGEDIAAGTGGRSNCFANGIYPSMRRCNRRYGLRFTRRCDSRNGGRGPFCAWGPGCRRGAASRISRGA